MRALKAGVFIKDKQFKNISAFWKRRQMKLTIPFSECSLEIRTRNRSIPPNRMFNNSKQTSELDSALRKASYPNASWIALSAICLGLLWQEPCQAAVIGYWRFESGAVTEDSGPNDFTLKPRGAGPLPTSYQLPASGPGAKFSNPIPQTGQPNTSAISMTGTTGAEMSYYHEDASAFAITSGITIEAYVNLSIMPPAQGSRVIASQGGSGINGAWAFVINDAGSLIFQSMTSAGNWGSAGFESLNSGLSLIVGHDYYVSYSSNLSDTSAAGAIFYLQDLTAGTALQIVGKTHVNTTMNDATVHFAIGSSSAVGGAALWAGVIDEVRLSNVQLDQSQLLISVPEPSTYLLLMMGAIGLLCLYQRNKSLA